MNATEPDHIIVLRASELRTIIRDEISNAIFELADEYSEGSWAKLYGAPKA